MELIDRLDPAHQSVLRAIPEEFLDLTDIAATRVRFDQVMAQRPRPQWPDGLGAEDHLAPGRDGGPDVSVRLYRPAGLAAPAPALYWVHGGGMVLGSVAMDEDQCAGLADSLQIVVASVEYRLAPEHPFPAPVEDCYTGWAWLAANAATLGVDPGRVAIGGGSAGGGLAAGLALLARDRGGPAICFQLLVYPMLDDRNATPSSHAVTDPRLWNRTANQLGWGAYLSGRAGEADVSPYAAPARATDLAGLPPTYINVGELDLFLDEDIAYAQALVKAGVPTELHVYPGAFHGSNNFVSRSALSRRWAADERAALARALHGSEP
ncbi:MAG: alpha/beta hydrolase fold domain-containing protein [Acidimicrobiia bacterium]|nr:alpha/beta hydrolase fold domain-containing protein [Acidimicrobiia bacterium]